MKIDTSMALSAYNYNTLNKINMQNADDTKTDKALKKQDELLREQTDAFEAFLIKQVLDISLKDDEKAQLFPKAAGSDIYKSMYNDTMSQALSGGLGFSELLYNFLKERS